MSDKEREVFEVDCANNEVYVGRHHKYPEQYQLYETQLRWMGWQACAAHYAPKVTERELEIAVGKAIISRDKEPISARVMKALRAAGVRFRDEPNPEPGSSR